jgi:hypothetical protein
LGSKPNPGHPKERTSFDPRLGWQESLVFAVAAYWIIVGLLADNDPEGRIASTSFSWARRFIRGFFLS